MNEIKRNLTQIGKRVDDHDFLLER